LSRKRRELPVIGQEPDSGEGWGGAEITVLRVEGMDCASCAATVERSVARVPGVRRAAVNFATGRLDVRHEPAVDEAGLRRAVERAGYRVERGREAEPGGFWLKPRTLSVFAAALLFASGLVIGLGGGPEALRVGAYAAAILVGGLPIFRAALAGLRARHLDMNVLMSLAVAGGAAIGEWAEAASVVVLFAAGTALQVYAVDRTRGAVRALARLAPDEVPVRRGGEEVLVPAAAVEVGETVVLRPGERVALDGVVREGSTAVDESPVTGESTPVEKGPGDEVFSGTLNGPGGVLVRVTRRAEDSTLQQIVRMVEEAQGSRAPAEQFVDRFARVYTPAVVAVAVALAAVPPLLGASFEEWFYRALALLIIACPCALVISTPVTVVSGIGAASRTGVLIKSGAALEAAGRLRTLAVDKTGTLTEGRPVLSRVVPVAGSSGEEVLRLAAALERRSEHPLAHAILSAAGERELPEVRDYRAVAGRGAEGVVAGERLVIGSRRMFEERGIPLRAAEGALAEVEAAGETPVILGRESGVAAVFGLADAVRPEAQAAVEALRRSGVRVVMLTGDAEAPARRIASELSVEYRASLLPEQKVEAVRQLARESGPVGMVGDGINDAPALAAATVGFTMGAAGSGVALETSDIALMRDDLSRLAGAVELSRSAEGIIKQNVLASILVKGVFVLLAPFGLVTLWLAVLADMGTSLAVTLNGLRLFGRRRRSGTT
jgi:Cd2+/Zn2+-exporting ATPase